MIKILFIGDVVSSIGCRAVRLFLPKLKERYGEFDLVVANAENSARGNGVSKDSAEYLFQSGCDVLTGGNHSFRNFTIHKIMQKNRLILRPLNLSKSSLGSGFVVFKTKKADILIVNFLGQVFLDAATSAFEDMKWLLSKFSLKHILVDFHAEATGEKGAFANFFDGKISAVVGTHTHVQTNDFRILKKGTAFISDAGMVGPYDSVLGVVPELVIRRMTTKLPTKFEVKEEGEVIFNGVYIELEEETGKAKKIENINEKLVVV